MYQESSHGVKKKMVLFEYNQVSISIYYQTVCSLFPLMAYLFLIVCVHIFSLSSAGPGPVVPQVSQYLYFLFAPTLIYRDKYPRYCFVLSHGAYIEHFYVLFCFTVEL